MKKEGFLCVLLAGTVLCAGCGEEKTSGSSGFLNNESNGFWGIGDNDDSESTDELLGQIMYNQTGDITGHKISDGSEGPLQNLKHDLTLEDLEYYSFCYASGVGAWSDCFEMNEDGSFKGYYHDSDMGDCAEGYENGTVYCCSYEGQLSAPLKINDHAYEFTLEKLTWEEHEEEIKDNIRYVFTEPCGLGDGKTDGKPAKLIMYMPGTDISEVEDIYHLRDFENDEKDTLEYALLCFDEIGFEATYLGSPANRAKKIVSDTTDYAESCLEDLDSMTEKEAREACEMVWQQWDYCINSIWYLLENELPAAEFEALRVEQREWIKYKEEYVTANKADDNTAGLSDVQIEANAFKTTAELTEERCYVLLPIFENGYEIPMDPLYKSFLNGEIKVTKSSMGVPLGYSGYLSADDYLDDGLDMEEAGRSYALVDVTNDGVDELVYAMGIDPSYITYIIGIKDQELYALYVWETHTSRMGNNVYSNGMVYEVGGWGSPQDDYMDFYSFTSDGIMKPEIWFRTTGASSDVYWDTYYLNGDETQKYTITSEDELEQLKKNYEGEPLNWIRLE